MQIQLIPREINKFQIILRTINNLRRHFNVYFQLMPCLGNIAQLCFVDLNNENSQLSCKY